MNAIFDESSRVTPIVRSLLDVDLYKLPMWQTMFHRNPETQAEYEFICRNKPEFPLSQLADEVDHELSLLCNMRFSDDELNYLRTSPHTRFLKSDFIDFLALFQLQRKFINVSIDGERLVIKAKGPIVHVMFFEIFVLYIVSELYHRRLGTSHVVAVEKLRAKIQKLKEYRATNFSRKNPFVFFDFGCRRRMSYWFHETLVKMLAEEIPEFFKGTSSVYLAMKYNLVPIGTMAHEYLQMYQQMPGVQLRYFQRKALQDWVEEFRGDLGIVLTDVIGNKACQADFDLFFAKLFDGARHDSGDPFEWGESWIEHYKKLKIDPNTKRLVFSDGLDLDKALALYEHFADRAQTGFGIGTNLTCDSNHAPLQIVMKLVLVNGQAVAKLPDTEGKTLCHDAAFLEYLRKVRDQIIEEQSYAKRH